MGLLQFGIAEDPGLLGADTVRTFRMIAVLLSPRAKKSMENLSIISDCLVLKMKVPGFFETSWATHPTVQHHNLEEQNPDTALFSFIYFGETDQKLNLFNTRITDLWPTLADVVVETPACVGRNMGKNTHTAPPRSAVCVFLP
jgi:hypothetical protein